MPQFAPDEALQHHYREAGDARYRVEGFEVRRATPELWRKVEEWARAENWNLGPHDAECFMSIDPEGFFVGLLDGRPVSAVSLVNYSPEFAVWGNYLVSPEHRGRGFGIGVWKVASRHAGDRVTAGDGMPDQIENYAKHQSRPHYRTQHYLGSVRHVADEAVQGVHEFGPGDLADVVDFDAAAFPARREGFLARWTSSPGHRTWVSRGQDGAITGFAVLRPAQVGYRIGPWEAEDPRTARALLHAAIADLDEGERLSAFAPVVNPATAALLEEVGLEEHFFVYRMYRGEPPEHRVDRMFALSSLEVG